MGLYLNPGNQSFVDLVRSGGYVDKTGLISYLNNRIGKEKHLIASSRPRRFGKTLAVRMLEAYYSRAHDTRELFSELAIAEDSSFERHLNQYDVISLDIQWMRGMAIRRIQEKKADSIVGYLQSEVVQELREAYPAYVPEGETLLAGALARINEATKQQFVILIDEWDCLFREDKDNRALQEDYIAFLRSLFKGRPADEFVKLAYITGILPIKKYGTQSALNNFRELTMIAPGGIAKYIGFTEQEVKSLCKQHEMPFSKMKKWYDGYYLNRTGHIYSPNSVMEALENEEFQNYWSKTETYESLKLYIDMNFDDLRQKIVALLGGSRCRIDVDSFQNDMTTFCTADDVLTLLVHLGYLAYNSKTREAFIPNEEVRAVFVSAVKDEGWGDVYQAIQNAEALLDATLAMDEAAVAALIQDAHLKNSASLVYNNEVSLASVIQLAYYTAAKDYTLIRELPTGEGFADMVFLPKRRSGKPALLVELKWNRSAEGALSQIKEKRYVEGLKEYRGNLLLVGINYDKKTKAHTCKIEKFKKDTR